MTLAEVAQIAIIFILSLFSSLTTSILIQRRLKSKNLPVNQGIEVNAANAARALESLGREALLSLEGFPDKDGDGVPDAFQRRRPLSEMLEFDKQPAEPGEPMTPGRISSNPNEYWIAIELPPRHPRKHEYFILNREIIQSTQNYTNLFQAIIIKQTRGCRPEDLVELSK